MAGVAVALAVIALFAPEIITGTFSDVGTAVRVFGLLAAMVLWIVLLRRFAPASPLTTAVTWVPIVAIGAVLLWPYFRPATEVDEAFPTSFAAGPTTSASASTLPPTTLPSTSLPSTTLPSTTLPPTNPGPTTAPPTTAPATAAPTTTVPPTTVPPEPVLLGAGEFQGLTGHRGNGTASIYDLPDGSRLLRFEEVDIGSGPRLVVYVAPGADRRDLSGAIEIAPLTAERGTQNYELPTDLELDGDWTVLVWCETFALEVANATLAL